MFGSEDSLFAVSETMAVTVSSQHFRSNLVSCDHLAGFNLIQFQITFSKYSPVILRFQLMVCTFAAPWRDQQFSRLLSIPLFDWLIVLFG